MENRLRKKRTIKNFDADVFKLTPYEILLDSFLEEDIMYTYDYSLNKYGIITEVILKGKYDKYSISIASDFEACFIKLGDNIETYIMLYDDPTIDQLLNDNGEKASKL